MKSFNILLLTVIFVLTGLTGTSASILVSDNAKPIIVMLPIVDKSGWPTKYSDEAIKVINNRFDAKFDSRNFTVIKGAAVEKVVQETNFDNSDAPILQELIAVGNELRATYVAFFAIDPIKAERGGFGIGLSSGTLTANMNMKMKFVDVTTGKYVLNKVINGQGKSTAVTIGIFGGGPSPKNAVGAATNNCMNAFVDLVGIK